jgi:pilus assembly protein Flp/PilA
VQTLLRKLLRNDDGASLVEYSLLVALVGVVAMIGVHALGHAASSVFNVAATSILNGNGASAP